MNNKKRRVTSWLYHQLERENCIDKDTLYIIDDRNEREKIDAILDDIVLIKQKLGIEQVEETKE